MDMASHTKPAKKITTRKPRRTKNVSLTEQEFQSLIRLWKEYHGETKAFAAKMAEIENRRKGQRMQSLQEFELFTGSKTEKQEYLPTYSRRLPMFKVSPPRS